MPASSGNRSTARASRRRLSVIPSVTSVRRGSHRSVVATPVEPVQPATQAAAPAPAGLSLISSARGVRLSRGR